MIPTRYRNVSVYIWNDDKFPFCSDDCQLVFLHLLTSTMSTGFGCYKASLEALAAEKRWALKRYRKGFEEGLRNGFLEYDSHFRVVFLPHFWEHNPRPNINMFKGFEKYFNELPKCKLKYKCYQSLESLAESLGKRYLESFRKRFVNPFPSGTGTGTGTGVEETPLSPLPEKSTESSKKTEELQTAWNGMAKAHGLPEAVAMSKKRASSAAERLRDPFFRDNWQEALSQIPGTPFLLGKNQRKWRANIDWFLQPDSILHIMEGKYQDNGSPERDRLQEMLDAVEGICDE